MGGPIASWSQRRKAAVGVAGIGAVVASVLVLSNLGDDGDETVSTASPTTTTSEDPTTTEGSTSTTVETTTTVAPTTTAPPPPTTEPPVTAPPTTAPPATAPPTTMPSVPPEFPFVRRGYTEGPPYFGLFYGQVPCCDRSHVWAVCEPGPVTITIIDNGSVDPVPPPRNPVYFGVWVDETTMVRDLAPAADGTVITGTVTSTVHIVVASPSDLPVRVQYDCRG